MPRYWKRGWVFLAVAVPVLVVAAVGLAQVSWIRWTPGAAIFFAVIVTALLGLSFWELVAPCVERKGFLPLPTTRGDRFFIGLLSAALLHIANLIVLPTMPWLASILAVAWMLVLLRWG